MSRNLIKPGAPDAPATGNARRVTNFPTGRSYRADLYVTGNFTQTGGSGDATAIEDSPFTFITAAEVKTRRGTLIRSSGQALKWLAGYEANAGRLPTSSAPSPSGAGSVAFSFHLPLPFAPEDLKVPEALVADLRDGEEPKLDITYGGATTLAAGGSRALTVDTVAADLVCAQEDEPVNPNLVRTIETITKPVTQAQADFQVDLTAQRGRRTRAIHIIARNGSTMVRSNALVTRVKLLKASGQPFFEASWTDLQEDNARKTGAAAPTGVAVIDFDRMKVLAKLPRTEEFSAYKLEMTVIAPTGTAEVIVTQDSVIDRDKFGV